MIHHQWLTVNKYVQNAVTFKQIIVKCAEFKKYFSET